MARRTPGGGGSTERPPSSTRSFSSHSPPGVDPDAPQLDAATLAKIVDTALPAAVALLNRLRDVYATSVAEDGGDWDLTTLVGLVDEIENKCHTVVQYSEHVTYHRVLSRHGSEIEGIIARIIAQLKQSDHDFSWMMETLQDERDRITESLRPLNKTFNGLRLDSPEYKQLLNEMRVMECDGIDVEVRYGHVYQRLCAVRILWAELRYFQGSTQSLSHIPSWEAMISANRSLVRTRLDKLEESKTEMARTDAELARPPREEAPLAALGSIKPGQGDVATTAPVSRRVTKRIVACLQSDIAELEAALLTAANAGVSEYIRGRIAEKKRELDAAQARLDARAARAPVVSQADTPVASEEILAGASADSSPVDDHSTQAVTEPRCNSLEAVEPDFEVEQGPETSSQSLVNEVESDDQHGDTGTQDCAVSDDGQPSTPPLAQSSVSGDDGAHDVEEIHTSEDGVRDFVDESTPPPPTSSSLKMGISWAEVVDDEDTSANDSGAARQSDTRPVSYAGAVADGLRPLGAWADSSQRTGDEGNELASQHRPITNSCHSQAPHVASPRRQSGSRGDNHHRQAKNIATPRRISSSRGAAVRILRRPGPAERVGRAATDMPRHKRTPESCAPSRSVDATKEATSQRRKGASADAKQRHKTLVSPASRGAFVSQQQADWAVQAYHILAKQFDLDRRRLHTELGKVRRIVADLVQRQTSTNGETIPESSGDDPSFVESRGATSDSLPTATVLATIPEESTDFPTTATTSTADDRCASDGDSSDALRKRIGSPSESVHPTDDTGVEDTSALVSTSARDNRVDTDVLSSDGASLRQCSTDAAQLGDDGIDVPVRAGKHPTGDEDAVAAAEGDQYAGGELSQQGAIAVAPSVRSTITDLQSVLTAPLAAFTLAPTSGDCIWLIDTATRLESQDGGLPPKPKRKRRRNRKRRRKRGRKKTTCDHSGHSPMTHPPATGPRCESVETVVDTATGPRCKSVETVVDPATEPRPRSMEAVAAQALTGPRARNHRRNIRRRAQRKAARLSRKQDGTWAPRTPPTLPSSRGGTTSRGGVHSSRIQSDREESKRPTKDLKSRKALDNQPVVVGDTRVQLRKKVCQSSEMVSLVSDSGKDLMKIPVSGFVQQHVTHFAKLEIVDPWLGIILDEGDIFVRS
ncbi:hypothetical protein THAOC_24651 [Thalassiosira oceanica]|uniref:Uncharacterized protein n=1 Tax=Thalassiosira oceanica TaxID=159749 RepID=K0S3R6_THAOC|nr:hypothetical protein THAOC_24651 [Thalassiosira oceanica]|eukprot:EJK55606.1 hypothetical protein THAOC_24651 [Thalassiosira oceanica]